MKGPFFAFAVLLSGLGVGVATIQLLDHVQIGSRAASPDRDQAWHTAAPIVPGVADLSSRHERNRGIYIVVLPAESPEFEQVSALPVCGDYCDACPCYEDGCGLDRTTGLIYLTNHLPASGQPSALKTVQIRIAESVPSAVIEADYLAHYDPMYDDIVYGVGVKQRDIETIQPSESGLLEESDAPLRLFRAIFNRPDLGKPRHYPRRELFTLSLLNRGVTFVRDYQRRLHQLLFQARLDDDWRRAQEQVRAERAPDWNDYELWADSLQGDQNRGSSPEPVTHAGREALQFAAQALHDVAELIQSAAYALERSAAVEVAKAKTEDSPAVSK